MNYLFLMIFLLFSVVKPLYGQELSTSKIVYKNGNDKNTIEVEKSKLLQFTYAFQENAASFKIKVKGYTSHNNVGPLFDAKAIGLLKKAEKGSSILIFDIRKEDSDTLSSHVVIAVQ